ncbi:hypothetical protein [Parashewanella tropica]|uniref:hypothetical protein n=1 Tax=Parashewanella tropica TaxID=2547970 RepID=UPI00105982CE|nr:hypothetical protein [Parashewanella tropica]
MNSKNKSLTKDTIKFSILFGLIMFLLVLLKILLSGNIQNMTSLTILKGSLLLVGVSISFGFLGALYERYYGD